MTEIVNTMNKFFVKKIDLEIFMKEIDDFQHQDAIILD